MSQIIMRALQEDDDGQTEKALIVNVLDGLKIPPPDGDTRGNTAYE